MIKVDKGVLIVDGTNKDITIDVIQIMDYLINENASLLRGVLTGYADVLPSEENTDATIVPRIAETTTLYRLLKEIKDENS